MRLRPPSGPAYTSPFTGAVRVLMLAIALWTGAVGPVMAAGDARSQRSGLDAARGEAADPCPGCPDDNEEGIPCAPTCSECACLPFARSLPAPTAFVAAPVLTLLAPCARVVREREAPSDPPHEAVFHPPRR